MSSPQGELQPVVRMAPPSELNAYVVFEHQLDALAAGSPASVMLNFSLFFLGVAATAFVTLWSLPANNDRGFHAFLIVCLITAIAGIVLLVLWWFMHRSAKGIVAEIKSQMPPNRPIKVAPIERLPQQDRD